MSESFNPAALLEEVADSLDEEGELVPRVQELNKALTVILRMEAALYYMDHKTATFPWVYKLALAIKERRDE